MRSFPGKAGVLGVLLLAGCQGEGLPDDPRPVASGEAVVPAAAVSARLEPSSAPVPAPVVSPPTGGGTTAVTVRDDPPVLSGPGLPPEVIRRITRQSFGRLRLCYGLASPPDPSGSDSVIVRYVIDADGDVSSAHTVSSTLIEPKVTACIERAFRGLSFPMPTGGPLTVNAKIYFVPPAAP
jgi:hypothetical protein